MNRFQKTLLVLAAIAIPAAAYTMVADKPSLCFASGAATYQIARNAKSPDFRIRIDGASARPDLRMQLVDRAELADFVLVDDFSSAGQGACRSSTPVRTVTLDADARSPDVTIHLSADVAPAVDYKLYVHSVRFSQQDAAALLGAMWKADQRRKLASRGSLELERVR